LEQCFGLEVAAEHRSESERAVVSEQYFELAAAAAVANKPEEVAVLEQH
jgi:hypothetical protein